MNFYIPVFNQEVRSPRDWIEKGGGPDEQNRQLK
jgi:hypothetical protein